jgi:hypothetical protein
VALSLDFTSAVGASAIVVDEASRLVTFRNAGEIIILGGGGNFNDAVGGRLNFGLSLPLTSVSPGLLVATSSSMEALVAKRREGALGRALMVVMIVWYVLETVVFSIYHTYLAGRPASYIHTYLIHTIDTIYLSLHNGLRAAASALRRPQKS